MKPTSQHTYSAEIAESAIEWLIKLQSPELTELEKEQFFVWLESNVEHQKAYIEAEKFSDQLDVFQALSASNDTLDSASTIEQTGKYWYPAALAAFIVLIVSIALAQLWAMWQVDTYQSVIGEQRWVLLKDGSRVLLNTDSQIRVKTLVADKSRMVYLDHGEAYFDVASSDVRAFLVRTEQGTVRVLGTQFVVRIADDDTWVTVLEGRVVVTDGVANKPASTIADGETILVADQQLSIMQAIKGEPPKAVDAVSLTSWQQGKLVYNGISFENAIKDISRYFDGEITLGAESLKTISVVAVLEITDKKTTIEALETAFNVKAVQHSESVTVLYPRK